ncbi:hypothetical protein VTP01DRAFT_10980, partial [Rhizomucor pusillus]|uniref:uncharacterized protein n=1 Tax=Rhizomucor pusillus TaxID=4840 RepID=UPI0037430610
MDYHPGRKNEYYLQHYDDDDDNSSLAFPHDDQEVDDHGTAVSNDDDRDNDHCDDNPGHDDDEEDSRGVVAHDERAPPYDAIPNSIWIITDGTNLAELCYRFKVNTLKLRNPVEQLSDLRHLALHDIYLFDTIKQASSVSKDWDIDVHRQAMASLSTYGH